MSKYLAVKNWSKYQSSKKNPEWIKDYVDQNDDKELADLSLFERGLLQDLRRVRGRTSRNIYNDVTHISLAIHAKVTDRPHIRHALATLIARGFLILTNEQDTPLEERRIEEKRVEIEAEDAAQLPDLQLARKVIEELALTCDSRMMGSVAGAIGFCRKIEGKSANAAVEFLIAHGKDEIERGRAPTKFWFDDRKWRTGEGVNGHGQKQSALDRNREALRKATAAAGS